VKTEKSFRARASAFAGCGHLALEVQMMGRSMPGYVAECVTNEVCRLYRLQRRLPASFSAELPDEVAAPTIAVHIN
jgi:hypothetical protein